MTNIIEITADGVVEATIEKKKRGRKPKPKTEITKVKKVKEPKFAPEELAKRKQEQKKKWQDNNKDKVRKKALEIYHNKRDEINKRRYARKALDKLASFGYVLEDLYCDILAKIDSGVLEDK